MIAVASPGEYPSRVGKGVFNLLKAFYILDAIEGADHCCGSGS